MLALDAVHGEMALRGAVAGLLLFHAINLALPGPRPLARLALGGFVASVLAYVFCQQAEVLLFLPRPLAYPLVSLCVGGAAWLWVAARALFDDHFRWSWPVLAALGATMLLGLSANLPYFPDGPGSYRTYATDSAVAWLGRLHALCMLGFSALALWEVLRGWRDDLVRARRVARRWVAMGIGLYAGLALVIELALRGRPVGRLLPALHILGIGAIAFALALLVARRSLVDVLGFAEERSPPPGPQPLPATMPQPMPAPFSRPVPASSEQPVPASSEQPVPASLEQPVPASLEQPVPAGATEATPHTAPLAAARAPDKVARGLDRLDQAMTQDHAYRREGLTLADLAQATDMAEAALRELINQRLGYRNFNDFLHHHRLREATERLSREDLPILTIALDCGYGSIGPFNRAFKQRMGVTPTEFRAGARLSRAASGA